MIDCKGCKYIEALPHANAYCYMYKHQPVTCNRYTPPITKQQYNINSEQYNPADTQALLASMFK